MDARHCPECGHTVHGPIGQAKARDYHDELERVLVMLCQRTGITEEDVDMPWTWTAVVDTDDVPELEAES